LIRRAVGIFVASILFGLALLHLYWAAGGTWGLSAALGGGSAPSRIAPLIVAVLLLSGSAFALVRVGLIQLAAPPIVIRAALGLMTISFLAVAVINAHDSTSLERFGFAPFSALLAVLTSVLIFGSKDPAGKGG